VFLNCIFRGKKGRLKKGVWRQLQEIALEFGKVRRPMTYEAVVMCY